MPPLEATDRHQKALHWTAAGNDKFGQRKLVSTTAEELDVRWVNRPALVKDPKGNTIRVDATVVLDECQAVGNQDIFWEGALADVPGTAWPPIPSSGFMEVVAVNTTLSICGKFQRTTVGLMRWNDSLPAAG